MEITQSKKLYNGTVKAKARRVKVIKMLEEQLKTGVKMPKASILTQDIIGVALEPLTESDIKRINSELLTLKSRI